MPKKVSTSPLERVASLDFLRGLAIFVMTFAHCFYHVYDYQWVIDDPSLLFQYPKFFVGIGLFIAYLGSWNTFFLLLSATVNSLGMSRSSYTSKDFNRILYKKLIAGGALVVFGQIIESFGYYGYFGYLLQGKIHWTDSYEIWSAFFGIMTVQIIGWSLIITALLNYLLLRNEGHNHYLRNMLIYAFLTLSVLVLTPFVHNWVDSMNWKIPPSLPSYEYHVSDAVQWPNVHVQAYNASFFTWIMVLLAGELEPFFPCLATAFVGAMIGLTLGRPKPSKNLLKVGTLGAILSIVSAVLLIILHLPYSIMDERPALTTELIQLGGQVLVIMFMLRLVEFRGRGKIFANRKPVRYLRKWGIISLSVFWLEIFDIFPKWTLNLTFGKKYDLNFFDRIFGYGQLMLAVLVGLYSIFWYDLLIRLWAKVNFKFGFEWFLLQFQKLGAKQYTPRINVNLILNHVNWISYAETPEIKIPIAAPTR
ncbi:MAG: hypothetical protein ACTSX6_07990 [Candidatus Heimdallarchaeaceae archaeon]